MTNSTRPIVTKWSFFVQIVPEQFTQIQQGLVTQWRILYKIWPIYFLTNSTRSGLMVYLRGIEGIVKPGVDVLDGGKEQPNHRSVATPNVESGRGEVLEMQRLE